jgi:hypothetical protein
MYVLGGWLPSLFPFSVVIGLADPLAAGQVTEAQHGHSAQQEVTILVLRSMNFGTDPDPRIHTSN